MRLLLGCLFVAFLGMGDAAKVARRDRRQEAVASFNKLAERINLDTVSASAKGEDVKALFDNLLQSLPDDDLDALKAAREKWSANGGVELAEVVRQAAAQEDEDGTVPSHKIVQQSFYAAAKSSFRLRSRAFMLTFNSTLFVPSSALWNEFVVWVKDHCQKYKAKYWSATMEESLNSNDIGRVHLHCYFFLDERERD